MIDKLIKISIASVLASFVSSFTFLMIYPLAFAILMSIPVMTGWFRMIFPNLNFGFWDWFGIVFSVRMFLTFIIPIRWKMETVENKDGSTVEPARDDC